MFPIGFMMIGKGLQRENIINTRICFDFVFYRYGILHGLMYTVMNNIYEFCMKEARNM